MVCEVPRQRQLHVTRRGSFFEDPFFSDAWDDYSHAVRRIVDRFNRGWVNPSNRIRDSQYHSMYRTLRNARLNYSTHSARFKEEDNVYKLVMDVREFVGGDITVRTAGGTVSVRGKMEVGPDEGVSKDDDDDRSTISGRSTSGKTLHRRFTLPADADCEKVESSLSRDAVLTVTIPKRSDVHYIPVNIEGESNKENQNGSESTLEGARQPGIKRPSDTPVEPKSKKSLEEASRTSRRRRRRSRKEDEEDKDGNKDKKKERSRRRMKDKDYYTKFGDSFRDSRKEEEETEGKRRRREEDKNGERKPSTDRRSRRRESAKYEDVHEINIPVRIGQGDVFRPSSLHEPRIHNIEIKREFEPPLEPGKEMPPSRFGPEKESELQNGIKPSWITPNADNRRSSDGKPQMENGGGLFFPRRRSYPDRKIDGIGKIGPQLNLKPVTEVKYSPATHGTSNVLATHDTNNGPAAEDRSSQKLNNAQQDGKESIDNVNKPSSEFLRRRKDAKDEVKEKSPRPVSMPTIKFDLNDEEIPKVGNTLNIESSRHEVEESEDESDQEVILENNIESENDSKTKEIESNKDETKENDSKLKRIINKDTLETPKLSLFQRPSSPVSPGSRLVTVEQDPAMMEDGMFKDCWSDFSNTLQDVLSRLQELSSELGQKSKLLATTPSAEQSPPIGQEGTASDPFMLQKEDSPLDKRPNSHQNKTFQDDNRRVVGVGDLVGVAVEGTMGGAKENGNAHGNTWESGQGRYSEASASNAGRRVVNYENGEENEISDKGDKESDTEERGVLKERSKFIRPDNLSLRNIISPLQPSAAGERSHDSRPTSLNLNESAPGSLLSSLRKNSPVEALQKEFYRRSHIEEPASDAPSYSVPVVPDGGTEDTGTESLDSHTERGASLQSLFVGGPKEQEARTRKTLSPFDLNQQSANQSETSDTASGDVLVAGKQAESESWRDRCKAIGVAAASESRSSSGSGRSSDDEFHSDKRLSFLNNLNEADVSRQPKKREDICSSGKSSPVRKNFSYAPNIDASPESNVTDEEIESPDEHEIVHGRFTFPVSSKIISEDAVAKPQNSRDVTAASDVSRVSDVTRGDFLANSGHPKIVPSDDVMVCERPHASRAQTVMPTRSATEESKRFSRANRPKDLLLQESSDGVRGSAASHSVMGGVLSRGRKAPLETPSPGPYSAKGKESPPLPPYVRTKPEPKPKQYSGFGHINNDNVRRIRDAWGPKQDPTRMSDPPRAKKGASSPSTPTRKINETTPISAGDKNRSSAFRKFSQSPSRGVSSPTFRKASPSPSRRNTGTSSPTFRKASPSPSSGTSSPSHKKQPLNRFFKEESPLRDTKPSAPHNNFPKRSGQGRASPIPGPKGPSSPLYRKLPTDRFFRESSPASSKANSRPSTPSYYSCSSRRNSQDRASPAPSSKSSSKPTSPPYYDSRRSSLASQGRNSPAPPSPSCRRCCSRGARDTPSPSLERKVKDFSRRASDDKTRTSNVRKPGGGGRDSPCRTPTGGKDASLRRSPPVVDPPRASKVHQKIFRRFRDANLRPESEAICFKEEENKYTMILDVEEFVPGEVEVLQDDMVLTVKGRVETKSARGHLSVKTFHRTFDIPKNSKEEDIDSALSKDGILTIYVPKKRERVIKIELVD